MDHTVLRFDDSPPRHVGLTCEKIDVEALGIAWGLLG
jgi:hypothetical protein